jgi:hypothetical protein
LALLAVVSHVQRRIPRLVAVHGTRGTLARPQILCIAREKVRVRVATSNQNVICEQGGTPLCAIPALQEIQDFKGEGTVAFCIFPDRTRFPDFSMFW